MKTTIHDVAKAAGVSPATVSRVLNGKNYVNKEKKANILRAISELDYVPNALAQNLGRQKAGTIGILALRGNQQAFSNPYFSEVIRGISSITETGDIQIVLNNFESMDKELEACLRLAKSGKVDGFIMLSSRIHDETMLELIRSDIKFVLIGRVIENSMPLGDEVYFINTDNIISSRAAVEHLISCGARRIGIIMAPGKYVVSQDRFMGYRQALMSAGLRFSERLCVDGGYSSADARRAAEKLLLDNPDIDAIFATDDMKAVAAMKVIKDRGLRVPEDIMVIGHGDFEIAELTEPPLTTIQVPIFELGRRSARMLLDLIDGNIPSEKGVIIDTRLIVRQSTRLAVSGGTA